MFDKDVISLAHGDGTRRPHPAVVAAGVEAMIDSSRSSLEDYHFQQRHGDFDAAVRQDFQRSGISEHVANNIAVDTGTTRLFAGFLHACAAPRDVFLVPRSFYHPLPSWCDLFRVDLCVVPTTSDDCYKLSRDSVTAWLDSNPDRRKRLRGVFIFNPTQTGALYTRAELRDIADMMETLNLVVLEDSIFAGTEFPGEEPTTHLVSAAPELDKRIVTLKGASKTFNLANIRIGWACGPPDIIRQMNEYTTTTLTSVPFISKAMAAAALRSPMAYAKANSRECASRSGLVAELIRECNDVLADQADPMFEIAHRPQAGHAVLIRAPGLFGMPGFKNRQIRNSIDVARWLLNQAKVAIPPGFSLGFDETELRVTFGSVGLLHTRRFGVVPELVAVVRVLKDQCSRIDRYSSETLTQVSKTLAGLDANADDPSASFQAGRDLISEAFRSRILSALV